MKRALVLAYDPVVKAGGKFVLNVHDELQVECDPEDAEYIGEVLKQAIIDAGTYYNLNCPLDAEYKIGSCWAETH
jgi:DNA polymerase-1